MYGEVIKILARDENVDMLLVIGTGGSEFSHTIRDVMRKIQKPLVVAIINPIEFVLKDYEILMGSGIPVYPDPIRAANALARVAEYADFRRDRREI